MKNNYLILGKGFIGQRLSEALKWPVSTRKIFVYDDILSEIKKYKPKVIINCVGHTGLNNVDDCESAMNKTISSNTFLPILCAEAAIRNGIKFVHVSSGCIYQYDYKKQKPIEEDQTPDYYTLYYSRTKIYAENVLKELAKRCNILIARIRIPLDHKPHPRNILTKLLSYKKIIDVPNSITYIPDFIQALNHLIRIDARGIYNVVSKGTLRYPQILDIYRRYVPAFQYKIIDLKSLRLDRTNLVLSTKKLESTGFKPGAIQSILEECVQEYIKY